MNDIAELTLRINSLEARVAKDDLDKLEQQGEKTALVASVMEEAFKKLMTILGPAYLVHSISENISKVLELQEAYVRLSEIAGTTASKMSAFDLPARLAGTGLDSVAQSVARLSKSLGDAQFGDVQKLGLFKALGIDPKDGKDAADQMVILARSLMGIKDQNVAASASQQLLSRGFAEMRPFMKEIVEQGGLNARVTDEQAEKAKRYEDQLVRLKFQLEGQAITLGSELLPVLQEMVDTLVDATSNTEDLSATSQVILTIFQTLAVIGSDVVFTFKMIGGEIGVIAAQVAALWNSSTRGGKSPFAEFKEIGKQWAEDSAKARADLDAFQQRVMNIGQRVQDAKKAATGTDGADSDADAAKKREAALRKFFEDQRLYDARIAAAKGFSDQYNDIIKNSNAMIQESYKQSEISQEEMIAQLAANEDARLKVMRYSLERQKALHDQQGNKGKSEETAQAIAQTNAAIVANEALTQAKITSLRFQSTTDYLQDIAQRAAAQQISFQDNRTQLETWLVEQNNLNEIAHNLGLRDEIEYQSRLAEIHAKYEEQKSQITDEEVKKRYGINQVYHKMDLDAAGTFFNAIAQLQKVKSKEMFEIGKAGAIAESIVNTYKAATGAMAALSPIPIVGPALGMAAAAAIIAAGLANVSQIASAQYGSGGASGGATPTLPVSPTTGAPDGLSGSPVGTPVQASGGAQVTHIHLHGESYSKDTVRQLLEQLGEALRDGGRIEVDAG